MDSLVSIIALGENIMFGPIGKGISKNVEAGALGLPNVVGQALQNTAIKIGRRDAAKGMKKLRSYRAGFGKLGNSKPR